MKKLLYRDRWEIVLLIVVSALLILLGLRTTAANSRSLADSMSSYQKLIAGYDSQIKMQRCRYKGCTDWKQVGNRRDAGRYGALVSGIIYCRTGRNRRKSYCSVICHAICQMAAV